MGRTGRRRVKIAGYLVRVSFNLYQPAGEPETAYVGIHGMDKMAPLVPFKDHANAREWIEKFDECTYYSESGEAGRPNLVAVPIHMADALTRERVQVIG